MDNLVEDFSGLEKLLPQASLTSRLRLRNNGIDGINLGLAKEPAQRFDRYAEVYLLSMEKMKIYHDWRKLSSMEIKVVGITHFHSHPF